MYSKHAYVIKRKNFQYNTSLGIFDEICVSFTHRYDES